MSNLYENKIGPAGLPIGIGAKGKTVQVPEDGNPFDKLAIKDLNKGTYDRLNASIDDLDNRPGNYPDSLNTVDNISTDEIASLSEEKRTVEERIAFLKEEIQRQRNIKDAEDSPLMEIALHRFKAYGDPSGLSEIANRQQTKDMADLQKREADEANINATKDKLGRLNIIAKNSRAVLNDAKTKNENSDEHKSAVRDYNLARYDLISAAKATNDDELVKQYMDAYPEEIDIASSNPSEGESRVIAENDYEGISLDETMSASKRAKKLKEQVSRPKGMSDKDWIDLKAKLVANIKAAYKKELEAYKVSNWHKSIKALLDDYKNAKDLVEKSDIYNKLKAEDVKDEVIDEFLEKGKYTFKDVKEPEEPKYLK